MVNRGLSWTWSRGKQYVNTLRGPIGQTGIQGLQGTQGIQGDTGSTTRMDRYSGVTDASGNWTVTYTTPFSVTPQVQLQLTNPTTEQTARLVSSTASGFTANVYTRNSLTVLTINLLSFATTPSASAPIKAIVVEA